MKLGDQCHQDKENTSQGPERDLLSRVPSKDRTTKFHRHEHERSAFYQDTGTESVGLPELAPQWHARIVVEVWEDQDVGWCKDAADDEVDIESR